MRLGLITDIHNHPLQLACALERFREHCVDQVVTIGDSCDAFCFLDGALEVAELLQGSRAIGVWGNHDYALCREVDGVDRSRYSPTVLSVMERMEPRLEIEHCLFTHKDASIDPFDMLQLWSLDDDQLDLWKRACRGFESSPQRWQFIGHYHRWWAATEKGPIAWEGEGPLKFASGDRYFVVLGAVCNGCCAVLDLEANELQPLSCATE